MRALFSPDKFCSCAYSPTYDEKPVVHLNLESNLKTYFEALSLAAAICMLAIL